MGLFQIETDTRPFSPANLTHYDVPACLYRSVYFRLVPIFVLAVVVHLASCMAVPRLPGERTVQIDQETLKKIEIGTKDKEDVIEILGEPPYTFSENARWIYVVKSRRLGSMRLCGSPVMMDSPTQPHQESDTLIDLLVYDWHCHGRTGRWEITYLDTWFDPSGFIVHHQEVTIIQGDCADQIICRDIYGNLSVKASVEMTTAARNDNPWEGHCRLFAFSDLPAVTVDIYVNYPRPIQHLLRSQFHRFDLPVGHHEIVAGLHLSGGPPDLVANLDVDCQTAETIFIQAELDSSASVRLRKVNREEGQKQLISRTLAAKKDS